MSYSPKSRSFTGRRYKGSKSRRKEEVNQHRHVYRAGGEGVKQEGDNRKKRVMKNAEAFDNVTQNNALQEAIPVKWEEFVKTAEKIKEEAVKIKEEAVKIKEEAVKNKEEAMKNENAIEEAIMAAALKAKAAAAEAAAEKEVVNAKSWMDAEKTEMRNVKYTNETAEVMKKIQKKAMQNIQKEAKEAAKAAKAAKEAAKPLDAKKSRKWMAAVRSKLKRMSPI